MISTGIDGCKYGWFSVELTENDYRIGIHKNINELFTTGSSNRLVTIDIPIGLRTNESIERRCDLEARRILGPGRGSSIFPVPCRASIQAKSYREAHEINKANVSRGLSQQTWGIIPKILEVDNLLKLEKQFINQIQESHPEVAFWALNKKVSLKFNKKSNEGIAERLSILEKYDNRTREIFECAVHKYMRKDVAKDDIVDAICMAVTGQIAVSVNYKTIPTNIEIDGEGLEMKIVYYGGVV